MWEYEIHQNKINYFEVEEIRPKMKSESIDKLLDIDENSTSLIISDQSLPTFLNKLSEYIVKENTKVQERLTIFDKDDVNDLF